MAEHVLTVFGGRRWTAINTATLLLPAITWWFYYRRNAANPC